MKTFARMIFAMALVGIYECQAMEEDKRKPSFSKRTAPVTLDSSNYIQQIDEVLTKIIENNKEMAVSEKLLEPDKESINQETNCLLIAIEISRGKKYMFSQDIASNTEGRVGHYPLATLISTLFTFGRTLEQFSLHEKISKEQYDRHIFYVGELGMIHHKISFIEKLQNASEEKPREASFKKNIDEKCLIQ